MCPIVAAFAAGVQTALKCCGVALTIVVLQCPDSAPLALWRQVGRLWTSLADYFIRQGLFEKARDVYEEGLTTVCARRFIPAAVLPVTSPAISISDHIAVFSSLQSASVFRSSPLLQRR